jgi:hypothetical protein
VSVRRLWSAHRGPLITCVAANLFCAFIAIGTAKAQDVLAGGSDLLPQLAIGVGDRDRPEYDPLGIHLGAFTLNPQLNVQETYDDNIYARNRNVVGDSLTSVTGTLNAQTLGSGASLSADGSFTSNEYLHNSVEDYLDFQGGVAASDEVGSSTTLSATGQFSRSHVARQDPSFPQTAVTPPSLDTAGGTVDILHTLVQGNVDLNVQLLSYDYHEAELPGGVFISQDFKDRNELTFDLRDNFLIHRSVSAFVHVVHKEYNYHDLSGTLDRDAVADNAGGGATFQITNLMKGEIGVGVLRLRNHDAIDDRLTTISVRSNIEFFITPLLTATATVERSDGAANIPGSSSFIATTETGALDYESRRNLIVSATFAHSYRLYTGINATETTWQGGPKIRWLVNRSLKFDLSYTIATRNSAIPVYLGDNFVDHAVSLEVELAR